MSKSVDYNELEKIRDNLGSENPDPKVLKKVKKLLAEGISESDECVSILVSQIKSLIKKIESNLNFN